jgi:predicted nucleic acid-binding protein
MTNHLLDTNIILRIVQPQAPTHTLAVEAVAAILEQGDNVFITPQILIEFWAVTTRPVDVNGLGWSPDLAEAEIQQLQHQFPMLDDKPDVFLNWLQLVKQHAVQGKTVHDARLVAIMRTYGITHLLTFNVDDFQRYASITVVHPLQLVS